MEPHFILDLKEINANIKKKEDKPTLDDLKNYKKFGI